MGYALGVDLGGQSPAVVVDRGDGVVEDVDGLDLPSLGHLLEQVGDPLLDPPGHPAGSPTGRLADLVAACAAELAGREGATVGSVVVAHPAVWGRHRAGLLRSALARTGDWSSRVVPDALALATQAGPPGGPAVVAVLDVRAEGMTVTVVRRAASGPGVVVGTARTVPELGGADVPDAVLAHVRDVAGAPASPGGGAGARARSGAAARTRTARAAVPAAGAAVDRAAARRLRAECERVGALLLDGLPGTLAADPLAPGREVRMVPGELDARLRPRAARAVDAAADAVARTAPDGVDVVLVAGSVAALPLLTELLGARFDAPLVVVRDRDRAAARGAAALAHTLPDDAGDRGPDGAPAETGGHLTRSELRRRSRVLRRRGGRPVRVVAVAGTGALLLGAVAVAVSEDAFAGDGATPPAVTVTVAPDPAP